MKGKRDPRVNAGYGSAHEYVILLLMVAGLSAAHMALIKYFIDSGLLETNPALVVNVIRAYIIATAAVFMAIMAFFRRISWRRPMEVFGEAAKKTASGDFTVRIPPLRRDGKKDFIEVVFDDFNKMVAELSSIETMKNDFIANVSHEIKTPLSVIHSYAAALRDNSLNEEERREYAQTINEAAGKLSTIVSNILKMNKLENQKIFPKAETYCLSEQIRRCAASFADSWEQKNIGFEADLDEVNVCYDENMLEIVWNNLLSNAIKFTNPGGKITVSLKNKNGLAEVSVTDTGIGMDAETQKRAFEKFFQGDTSRAGEGNGLGLSIVRKTVELMDGTVSAAGEPGRGSTFTVCLKI